MCKASIHQAKRTDVINKPSFVHKVVTMLADSDIIDFIFLNNVIQTTKYDKFLNKLNGELLFMVVH